MRVVIVNLNLDSAELAGCTAIAQALVQLAPTCEAEVVHFSQLVPDGNQHRADGWVLGPQGTPFAAYNAGFLPWLAAWLDERQQPVLAICGGMQAVALALGGALGTVDGGPQAQGVTYGTLPRIEGLVPISVARGALPSWLAQTLALPQAALLCAQRHAEQILRLPLPLVAIAHSPQTPIEAWAHPHRPWLGCQFHPERDWQTGGEAGRLWLQAWLNAAGQATPERL